MLVSVRRLIIVGVVMGALAALSLGHAAIGSASPPKPHCVAYLVPVGPGEAEGATATMELDLGCYDTLEGALEVGSSGSLDIPSGTSPSELRAAMVTLDEPEPEAATLIGTEWVEKDYAQESKSYFASAGCANNTWEVSYVGNAWNDDFESGKGFHNCDSNRKFQHQDFGGDVKVCTPNCAGYGAAMNNEVSSLRWRD